MIMMTMIVDGDDANADGVRFFLAQLSASKREKNITSCFPVSYNATKAGDDKMMITMMMMMMMMMVRRRWRRKEKDAIGNLI